MMVLFWLKVSGFKTFSFILISLYGAYATQSMVNPGLTFLE